MNAVGVIPARWGSTRLPGKALVNIAGRPLIQWVWERASLAKNLTDLMVATDDRRIAAAVEQFGGRVIMTKQNHPSGTDRIAEAVRGTKADVVVNVQGDEPLVDPALIDRVAEVLLDGADWDMATAVTPMENDDMLHDPSVVKAVFCEDGRALYFSRAVIPFMRDARASVCAGADRYWRHIGIYGYQRLFLERLVKTPPCDLETAERLEQLRALHIGARMKVLQAESPGPGVDTPEDVPRAEEALRRAGLVSC